MVNGAKQLPDGWEWKTIGDVTLPIQKVDPAQKPDKEFTYLDIASIDNSVHRITEPKSYYGVDAPSRARQLVRANDVLFSTVRTYLEKIAQVPDIYDGQIASTGFSVLRANELVLPKYIFYYSFTQNFLEPLNELQRGTSYPAVRDNDVRVQLIPVAPLPEQERIVSRIDELFSDLEAGVASLERVRAGLKRYKASVLKAAVEGKLFESGEVVSGELPEGWRWVTVREIGTKNEQTVLTGPFGSNLGREDFGESGVAVLTIGCLTEYGLNLEKAKYISEAKARELEKYRVREGDLLFSRMATVGRAGLVTHQFGGLIFNYHLMRLRLDDELIDPDYFLAYVRGSKTVTNYVKEVNHGATRDGINTEQLLGLPVVLPPLGEQQRIVAEVERRLSVVGEVESAVDVGLVRAGRLRQSVLRSAFEGRL
jgi:type I restriction enzyme S subunit